MILYTNGCSYTFGSEMKNPIEDAWPYVLGKKLNWFTINDAIPAGSVIRVYRKTLNFIFQNLEKKDKLFIILCWPPKIRSEAYYKHIIRTKPKMTNTLIFTNVFNFMIKDFFVLTQQPLYCYMRSMFFQIQLQEILSFYHIPYIFLKLHLQILIFFLQIILKIIYT